MRKLLCPLTLFVVLGALAAFSYVNYPVVWGRDLGPTEQWIRDAKTIDLSGPVLFISDTELRIQDAGHLHMDLPVSNVKAIVIVGDFFESPSDFKYFGTGADGTDQQRIANALHALLPADYSGRVYWVSAVNHDPQVPPMSFDVGNIHFEHLGKAGHFVIDGQNVIAVHGDGLFAGQWGGALDWTASKLGFPLLLERIAHSRLGLGPNTWLVTGHTHVPGLVESSHVANSGSFAGVPFNSLLHVPVATGILFDQDGVRMVHFDGIAATLY